MIDEFPDLFSEDNSLIRIIRDESFIQDWQRERKNLLIESNLPQEWADIGIVLEDPYNIILRDLVQFPNGRVNGYTRSIATASLRGGQAVVVLPEYQGKLLLLHQYRHAPRKWHYHVPLGYGEPNIPARENAKKEIEEETGAKVAELVSLGILFANVGFEAIPADLFYARIDRVGMPEVNEGIESFVLLTVEDLEKWIADEKITDGFTIAAYTRAKLRGLI